MKHELSRVPIHQPTVGLVWLRPRRSLVTASMENSGDQEILIVSIVDDVALDDERANAFAELWPIATHARLFDEHIESIEDGINESIGGRGAGILGDIGPDLLEVLLGKDGQPIRHLGFLGASSTTARLDPLGELAT
jgi:hypothetical protein